MWNKFSKASQNLLYITLISSGLWVGFIFLQQWNYTKPHQVYLLGTNAAYGISFMFFFGLILFLFSFLQNRFDARKLKNRFILFAVFYLIMGPLTLLGFDNYLLITQEGIQYNPFFAVEDAKIHNWQEIQQVDLNYILNNHKKVYQESDIRISFIVHFEDGTSVNLNDYNSPLYRLGQFVKLYQVIKKNDIPIKVISPLPKELHTPNSYLYQLFSQVPNE